MICASWASPVSALTVRLCKWLACFDLSFQQFPDEIQDGSLQSARGQDHQGINILTACCHFTLREEVSPPTQLLVNAANWLWLLLLDLGHTSWGQSLLGLTKLERTNISLLSQHTTALGATPAVDASRCRAQAQNSCMELVKPSTRRTWTQRNCISASPIVCSLLSIETPSQVGAPTSIY